MKLKIYVAGTFSDQADLREQADRLWKMGHEVTGSWLNETKKPDSMPQGLYWKKLAIKDACEIYRADIIIQDNRQSSGGKNVEWGIAVGQFQHKQLWLVGTPTNVFQELADFQFNDWNHLFEYLEALNP